MSISIETVNKIAQLARLTFGEEEKIAFTQQFNKILDYIDTLNTLDTTNVEPLSQVTDATNVLRDDEPLPCLPVEDALRNAPGRLESFIKVPKVVE